MKDQFLGIPLFSWASLVISTALAILGSTLRLLWKIRSNDLHHIDKKLDAIQHSVDRVGAKLDRHLEQHIARSDPR